MILHGNQLDNTFIKITFIKATFYRNTILQKKTIKLNIWQFR